MAPFLLGACDAVDLFGDDAAALEAGDADPEATDGADAEGAAEAEAEAEAEAAAVAKAKESRLDKAGGHPEGKMQSRRTTFLGLKKSNETRHMRDGRTVWAYRINRTREYKLGDAVFEDGRWWFSRDDLLRRHHLWATDLDAAGCRLAAERMTIDYGPPDRDRPTEKVWAGERVMARWTDKTGSRSSPRCEVEWIDLTWFGR